MTDSKPHSDLLYAEQGKRDIEDLLIQATQERSHFYTAAVLRNTQRLIVAYEERISGLEEQLETLQRQAKANRKRADANHFLRDRFEAALEDIAGEDDEPDTDAAWYRDRAREALNPASTPPVIEGPMPGHHIPISPDEFPASGAGTSSAEGMHEANAAGPRESSPASEPDA